MKWYSLSLDLEMKANNVQACILDISRSFSYVRICALCRMGCNKSFIVWSFDPNKAERKKCKEIHLLAEKGQTAIKEIKEQCLKETDEVRNILTEKHRMEVRFFLVGHKCTFQKLVFFSFTDLINIRVTHKYLSLKTFGGNFLWNYLSFVHSKKDANL